MFFPDRRGACLSGMPPDYHGPMCRLFTVATFASLAMAFGFAVAFIFGLPETVHIYGLGQGWNVSVGNGNFAVGTDHFQVELPLFVAAFPFVVLPVAYLIVALTRERHQRREASRGFDVLRPG